MRQQKVPEASKSAALSRAENTLTIVVPTQLKRMGLLQNLLHSIYEQKTDTTDTQVEIILAVNSTDHDVNDRIAFFAKKQKKFAPDDMAPRFLFIPQNNKNLARNMAAAAGSGSLVYFLDDDCTLPQKTHLAEALTIMRSDQSSACIGGHYLSAINATLFDKAYNHATRLWSEKGSMGLPLLPAGNILVRRIYVGENFFPVDSRFGGEEIAITERFARQGLSVRAYDNLSVLHQPGKTFTDFVRISLHHGKGRATCQSHRAKAKLQYRSLRKFILAATEYYCLPLLYFVLIRLSQMVRQAAVK